MKHLPKKRCLVQVHWEYPASNLQWNNAVYHMRQIVEANKNAWTAEAKFFSLLDHIKDLLFLWSG